MADGRRQGALFHPAAAVAAARWLERVRAEFSVFVSDAGIAEIRMLDGVEKPRAARHANAQSTPLRRRAAEQIREYLRGDRRRFQLRADLSSLSPFMEAVLGQTRKIPYGETRSYGWVAREIGSPGASRAVGQALHRNPVPLLIP